MKTTKEMLQYIYKELPENLDRQFEMELENDQELCIAVNSLIGECYTQKIRSRTEYMRKIKETYPLRDSVLDKIKEKSSNKKEIKLKPLTILRAARGKITSKKEKR